jgi:ABC-2 type transport system ATP-binding protein
MILAESLTKKFDEFLAVSEISLRVEAGEVLALLGPNGAGKTTTVRMLTSVLRPTAGWATVAGYDIIKEPDQVRASVGVLTEQHGLYGRMHAVEYLDFFGQIYRMNPTTRQARTTQMLEQFGLYQDRKRRIGEYSKGMRQKLALARALYHNPPVLLLDEPTSAMDPESARLVRDAIHGLRSSKRAIIICTHNLAEAEELADKIAIIRQGQIIALGTPDGLKQELLGPPEYEIRLSQPLNGDQLPVPAGIVLTGQGSNWIRYRSTDPELTNPIFLKLLVSQDLPVLSLQLVPRNLEQVYLQAINVAGSLEVADVG